jgi:superfamily II DNA or RNA helicase
MVYDFRTRQDSPECTLDDTRTLIFSLELDKADFLFWDTSSSVELEKLRNWIHSADGLDLRRDILRACLLVSVSNCSVIPRKFQLEAGLAAYRGRSTIINAGTGSGKTLSMVIPLLMDQTAVTIIISPLKRLHSTQAKALEQFGIRPLVINEDSKLSLEDIKVFAPYINCVIAARLMTP